jgi:hypothetical protein
MSLWVYSTWCQLGITYDSLDYLHAAQTWRDSQTLYNANGQIYLERTPLYPLILSCGGMPWAKFLHFLALGINLWLWSRISYQHFQTSYFRYWLLTSLAVATPILLIHSFLWSEALFLGLLSAMIYGLKRYLQTANLIYFYALIMGGFGLCLMRNTGIFIIGGMALCALFTKKSIIPILISTLISASGWIIWTIYAISQKSLQYHPLFRVLGQDFDLNIWESGFCVSAWFLPIQIPTYLRLIFLLFILTFIAYTFFRENSNKNEVNLLIIKYLLSIIIAYFGGVCILAQSNGIHEAERYWAVMYPLFFYLLGWSGERLYLNLSRIYWKQIFVVFLLIWLLYPFSRTLKNTAQWHQVNCTEK